MLFGGLFDGVGIDVGDITADEGLDVVGDDELLHNDGAAFITERIVLAGNWIVQSNII